MNNINVDSNDDNMSATTTGISVTSSQIPTMPIELVIPPPQSRVVKEGWVYKRGFKFVFQIFTQIYIYFSIKRRTHKELETALFHTL